MPGPIGNKHNLKYTPERRKELGEALCKWCKQDKINWHLYSFEVDYDLPNDTLDYLNAAYNDFHEYYQKAKKILGEKYLKNGMTSNTSDKWILSKFVPMYLNNVKKYLHEETDREIDSKEKAKAKHAAQENAELLDKLNKYLELKK